MLSCLVLAAACGPTIPAPQPLPPELSFSGMWDTNWGQMTLVQKGALVHGEFTGFRNGSVTGVAQGNLFRFRWTQRESRQHGRGYLQMTADGRGLEGRWGYLKDSFQGGRWWATRAR